MFEVMKNTRARKSDAPICETKSSTTKDILGMDIETDKKWSSFQMADDTNWNNIQSDRVRTLF